MIKGDRSHSKLPFYKNKLFIFNEVVIENLNYKFIMNVKSCICHLQPAAPVVVSTGLGPEDVNAHLVFHYGIPPSSTTVAYDPINKIIAISSM